MSVLDYLASQGVDVGRSVVAHAAAQATFTAPADIRGELVRVRAERMRRSLALFVQEAWPHVGTHNGQPMIWNWHNEVVCRHVQDLLESLARAYEDPSYKMPVKNAVFNIPPGSGKTMMISVLAPIWAWTRWPWMGFRVATGNPRVSKKANMFSRDLLDSDWFNTYFPNAVTIRPDKDSTETYVNTAGGERINSTFKTGVTGERTHVILWDDPHDAKEVASDTTRESETDKFTIAMINRVHDMKRCVRIGIMQRLHETDLTGVWLAKGNVEHVKIPTRKPKRETCKCASCVAGKTWLNWSDPREPGQLLHEERFGDEEDAQALKDLRAYGYAGQHDQNPSPIGGGLFKYKSWRFWKKDGDADYVDNRPDECFKGPASVLPDKFDRIVITLDAAFKGGVKNDRVAFFVIGTKGADRYILDRRVAQMTFTATVETMKELDKLWPLAFAKYVEDKANGPAIIDTLSHKVSGLIAVNPMGGKEARAAAMSPGVQANQWYLPERADWLEDFIGEFGSFPNGKNDDQVDACSQASIQFLDPSSAMIGRQLGSM